MGLYAVGFVFCIYVPDVERQTLLVTAESRESEGVAQCYVSQ